MVECSHKLKDNDNVIILKHPKDGYWDNRTLKKKKLPERVIEKQPFTNHYSSIFSKSEKNEDVLCDGHKIKAHIYEFEKIDFYT